MDIKENHSLKAFNTFALDAKAAKLCIAHKHADILETLKLVDTQQSPLLVLGGGSNVLFSEDYSGIVLINKLSGLKTIRETKDNCWIKFAAGLNWHDCVHHCVKRNLAGIENLSLIPGTIGATPIQNIGAYGVELKDVFDSLEALNIKTRKIEIFNIDDCQFGYRDSIFKNKAKNKYIILSVTLRLTKKPSFNINYGSIQSTLESMNIDELSAQHVSNAVIKIRQSKLPDPNIIPNAGSFFKNPYVSIAEFEKLSANHPDMPYFKTDDISIKIPAAWLIDASGFKGKRIGRVGVYDKQALVLANYDNGSGDELVSLSQHIQADVKKNFGIKLETEVTII